MLIKRESGENPLQPPLLYTATNSKSTGYYFLPGKEEGGRPVSQETCLHTICCNLSEGKKIL